MALPVSFASLLWGGRSTPTPEAEKEPWLRRRALRRRAGQGVEEFEEGPSAEKTGDRHAEVKAVFEAKVGQDVDGTSAAEEREESHSGQGLGRGGVRLGGW